MKSHELILSRENPHVCKYCDKPYTWVSDLRRHEPIHNVVNSNACKFCGESFIEAEIFKRHELIQSGAAISHMSAKLVVNPILGLETLKSMN